MKKNSNMINTAETRTDATIPCAHTVALALVSVPKREPRMYTIAAMTIITIISCTIIAITVLIVILSPKSGAVGVPVGAGYCVTIDAADTKETDKRRKRGKANLMIREQEYNGIEMSTAMVTPIS
jgi:hypothetical protein